MPPLYSSLIAFPKFLKLIVCYIVTLSKNHENPEKVSEVYIYFGKAGGIMKFGKYSRSF